MNIADMKVWVSAIDKEPKKFDNMAIIAARQAAVIEYIETATVEGGDSFLSKHDEDFLVQESEDRGEQAQLLQNFNNHVVKKLQDDKIVGKKPSSKLKEYISGAVSELKNKIMEKQVRRAVDEGLASGFYTKTEACVKKFSEVIAPVLKAAESKGALNTETLCNILTNSPKIKDSFIDFSASMGRINNKIEQLNTTDHDINIHSEQGAYAKAIFDALPGDKSPGDDFDKTKALAIAATSLFFLPTPAIPPRPRGSSSPSTDSGVHSPELKPSYSDQLLQKVKDSAPTLNLNRNDHTAFHKEGSKITKKSSGDYPVYELGIKGVKESLYIARTKDGGDNFIFLTKDAGGGYRSSTEEQLAKIEEILEANKAVVEDLCKSSWKDAMSATKPTVARGGAHKGGSTASTGQPSPVVANIRRAQPLEGQGGERGSESAI